MVSLTFSLPKTIMINDNRPGKLVLGKLDVAHSSRGLGHLPLKEEITGSNPVCATNCLHFSQLVRRSWSSWQLIPVLVLLLIIAR